MAGILTSVVAGGLAGLASSYAAARLKLGAPEAPSQPSAAVEPASPVEPPSPVVNAPPSVVLDPAPGAAAIPGLIRALTSPAEEVGDPRELVDLPEFQALLAVFRGSDVAIRQLSQHALGANWPAACAAFLELSTRPDRASLRDGVVRHLAHLRPYVLPYAFGFLCSLQERPAVGVAILAAPSWWPTNSVIPDYFDDYFARAADLGDPADFGEPLDWRSHFDAESAAALLSKISHPYGQQLLGKLRHWQATRVDANFLRTVGALWDPTEPDPTLVAPETWRKALDAAEAAIRQPRPRSVLVCGDPRIGKTSLIKLLGERLQTQGWTVFAASGAELMADQIYIGQLEGRIRQIVEALNARRKVIWVAPDLGQLADSGTHKGQAASILDQILPAMAAGQLVVVGESSQAAATRLFQTRPSLRSVMEVVALEPMEPEATFALALRVAERISERSHLEIPDDTVAMTRDLAQQYLGEGQLPGVVLELLKRAAARAAGEGSAVVAPDDVLETLSQISGLPSAILDTGQRVELGEVRAFFSRRVIGQDEAVRTLVDRIAMLKAGLTDPGKPIGVFLFAGPTGTGKTELAKTLADFLFGSADRMLRLDMSEFQSFEATAKILGQRGDAGDESLIDRIRKQPFSVILLDEFEKAHPNCWDLFLQIFDDGRLSDANGRLADFRHAIIILTSNLGAGAHRGNGLGFGRQAAAFSEDQVLSAIASTFRPEFINRLDKVVVFQPLSRDLMRGILHKELARVLERRGLRDRAWAVEWEPSAIEFLLDRGFSPEMGARPLKRAIDQLVLAPLAATLVEHRFPEGDQFLFVRSNGQAIEVEFVDPDAEPKGPVGPERERPDRERPDRERHESQSLPAVILRASGSEVERAALGVAWRSIAEELGGEAWRERTDALRLALAEPGFWSRPDRFATFSSIELGDRISEAARSAERLFERYQATRGRAANAARELAGRLAVQLYNLRAGMDDLIGGAPIDALLTIEPALELGGASREATAWSARVKEMYRLWASKRRMQLKELASEGTQASPLLLVTGFGAFRTLSAECGLHVLEDDAEDAGKRLVARVNVVAGPDQAPDNARAFADGAKRLAAVPAPTRIVRRYREKPAAMVRDVAGGWRSGRLEAVLGGDFDLIGAVKGK